MSLTGSNNEEKIWNFLYSKIGNAYGVAGLMGNLQAESGLEPTNLQDSYEKKLGYTDSTYTSAVDNGTYTNFVKDSAGYGLAQWTYYSRKQGLLDYVQSKKASIGDLESQLNYLYNEMSSDFSSVLSSLKSATSVKSASNTVLTKYEQPADQGSSVQTTRANYGQTFYDKYASSSSDTNTTSTTSSSGTYDKYIYSSGTHYISNCGHDENGKYSGGTAGDQTGDEWYLRSWYNRPWNCVLRYPDEAVALKLAELGCAAALNDKIGYDQNQRDTYWTQLKANSYDPSKITTACEADCSSGIIANTKAVGYLMGISALQNISATYTGNMRSAYKSAGFTVLTDSKYLTGTTYLQPGDILLNDSAHTATNVTNGSKSSFSGTSSGSTSSGSGTTTSTATSIDYASYFNSSIAGKYTVTASSLNLRSGASTSKTILVAMPKGSTVQCYGYYSTTNKVNWLLVEYVSGSTTYTGFCSSEYLSGGSTTSGTTTSSTNPKYYVQVKISDLRIRTGAGTNYSWTGKYTGVGCFGITEEKSGTGASKWGKLLSGAGWISLDYATKI